MKHTYTYIDKQKNQIKKKKRKVASFIHFLFFCSIIQKDYCHKTPKKPFHFIVMFPLYYIWMYIFGTYVLCEGVISRGILAAPIEKFFEEFWRMLYTFEKFREILYFFEEFLNFLRNSCFLKNPEEFYRILWRNPSNSKEFWWVFLEHPHFWSY